MKALIFGASGSVGQEVLKVLQQEKLAVHAVRRQKGSQDPNASTQWFAHDILQGPGSDELWAGVTHVFLMSPAGYTEQDKILNPVIEKAKAKGIKKLVLMTAMGVNHAVGSPLQRVETSLKSSGIGYAIIRPNWFLQNFHTYWGHALRSESTLFIPGGSAKVSFIDVRDIGAVAARLLTSDQQGEFDLTGAEALTHAEAAAALSKVLERPIRYVDADPQVFKKGLLAAGLPEDYASFMLMILGALREGHAAPISNNVETILKRRPLTITDYARTYASALAST